MTRINYVLKELVRNIYRNPATSLGSFLSLALLFLLFDIFWIAARTSDQLYAEVISDLKMDVFIPEDIDDSLAISFSDKLYEIEGVRSVEYVSREMARSELTLLVGIDLLVGYDSLNPLPRSYTLLMEPNKITSEFMDSVSGAVTKITKSQSIQYSSSWLSKAEQSRTIFERAGFALGVIILLTALVSSANNIRLMARVRNVELRQLLLIGSGKLFATMPFLFEGFLFGGLAASAGWLAIIYAHQGVTFTQFTIVLPSQDEMILFSLACAMIGAISGFMGARRLLK